MKKYLLITLLLVSAGCESSSPDRKKIEEIAKRNPLDMANEDAKTVVLKQSENKPKYPKVPTVDANVAPIISGKSSKIYHVRSCEYAGKSDSVVGYATWSDAERSGRVPCEFCRPRENAK